MDALQRAKQLFRQELAKSDTTEAAVRRMDAGNETEVELAAVRAVAAALGHGDIPEEDGRDIGFYLQWALDLIEEHGFEEFALRVRHMHQEASNALAATRARQSPLRALSDGWRVLALEGGQIQISSPDEGPGVVTLSPTGSLERRMLHALASAVLDAKQAG